jgi:hypothetical protein
MTIFTGLSASADTGIPGSQITTIGFPPQKIILPVRRSISKVCNVIKNNSLSVRQDDACRSSNGESNACKTDSESCGVHVDNLVWLEQKKQQQESFSMLCASVNCKVRVHVDNLVWLEQKKQQQESVLMLCASVDRNVGVHVDDLVWQEQNKQQQQESVSMLCAGVDCKVDTGRFDGFLWRFTHLPFSKDDSNVFR